MKLVEKIKLAKAFGDWLEALDPIADCRIEETDKQKVYYKRACLALRKTLRYYGYSANCVNNLRAHLQEDVNY